MTNGEGTTSNVIRAIQWAIDNRVAKSIDVINLSLGHPIYEPAASDPLVQAVEAAVRSGIVVVVSAGNVGRNPDTGVTGYAGIASPGNAPSAITVGAVRTQDTTRRTDDLMAEYSSRGPSWYDAFSKPDVVAPGHRILAASDTTMKLYQRLPDAARSQLQPRQAVPLPERHQHGGGRHLRHGGAAARVEQAAVRRQAGAERGEGDADGIGLREWPTPTASATTP